jgi:N-acyl-D-amino-acid deacylase
LQSLQSKYHPFIEHPTFERELAHLVHEDKVAAMRQPEMRAQLLSEVSYFADKPFAQVIFSPENLYFLADGAGRVQYERDPHTESIASIARATGSDPMALIYDCLVGDKVLWAPLGRNPNQDMPLSMLQHPNVKVGLGDGGAHLGERSPRTVLSCPELGSRTLMVLSGQLIGHAGIFQEATCPTFMLTHYVRDRVGERIPLAQAIKMQVSCSCIRHPLSSLPHASRCAHDIILL